MTRVSRGDRSHASCTHLRNRCAHPVRRARKVRLFARSASG